MYNISEEQGSSQNHSPSDDQTRRIIGLEARQIALVLFIVGLAFITLGAIVPEQDDLVYELVHHLLRDLGIAAIISGLLGSAYEFKLRRDFLDDARNALWGVVTRQRGDFVDDAKAALSGVIAEEREWLTKKYIEDAETSLKGVLNERDERLKQLNKLRAAGLTDIRQGRDFATIKELFEGSPKQVRILETWTGHREMGIDKWVRKAAADGAEIRILLLDPDSEQVRYRATALAENEDVVKTSIEADLEKLEEVRLDYEDRIKIKVYASSPSINLFRFDDVRIFGLYLWGFDSIESPQFTVDTMDQFIVNTEGQFTVDTREHILALQLDEHFQNLWDAQVTREWPTPKASSLEGTLPNAQKYENRLRDNEGSGEDGENSDPS